MDKPHGLVFSIHRARGNRRKLGTKVGTPCFALCEGTSQQQPRPQGFSLKKWEQPLGQG